MKIIVSHVYSKENNGDAALLSVLLTDIHRAFDKPEITILTIDTIGKNELFDGIPEKNAFMYYAREAYRNSWIQPFYAAYVAVATLLWAWVYRHTGKKIPLPQNLKNVAELYLGADLVIPVGGGYVRGQAGFMSTMALFFTLHPFLFTALLGKPTVAYTQSVGPFGNKLQEVMAKFAIKRINGIIVRENISLQLLKKWGVIKNVFSSVDSGFSFTTDIKWNLRKEMDIPRDQMVIGITVRSWFKSEQQNNYEQVVAKLADHIIKKYNAIIIFIPQVAVVAHDDDDRQSGKRVYKLMEHPKNARVITKQYEHHEVKAIYENLDYLVGTRFHSVIFALTSYVPCIAIEYEHKTRGIMADLGLEKWVLSIKKIKADALIALFDQLVISRESYIHHLEKILPGYIEQAKQAIGFVKKIYGQKPQEADLTK